MERTGLEFILPFGADIANGIAIPLVKEARLHLYIEHLFGVTVIILRVFGQLRLLVIQLYLLGNLGRQLAHKAASAEKVLAVHHQTNGLFVPKKLAVALLNARKFADKYVESVAIFQLEGLRMKHNCVANHRDSRHLCTHFDLLKHDGCGAKSYRSDVQSVLAFHAIYVSHAAMQPITDERKREDSTPFAPHLEFEMPEAVGLTHPTTAPIVALCLGFDADSDQRPARFGVHNNAFHRVSLQGQGHVEAINEQQNSKPSFHLSKPLMCVFTVFIRLGYRVHVVISMKNPHTNIRISNKINVISLRN